jgi:hypothetical protein
VATKKYQEIYIEIFSSNLSSKPLCLIYAIQFTRYPGNIVEIKNWVLSPGKICLVVLKSN